MDPESSSYYTTNDLGKQTLDQQQAISKMLKILDKAIYSRYSQTIVKNESGSEKEISVSIKWKRPANKYRQAIEQLNNDADITAEGLKLINTAMRLLYHPDKNQGYKEEVGEIFKGWTKIDSFYNQLIQARVGGHLKFPDNPLDSYVNLTRDPDEGTFTYSHNPTGLLRMFQFVKDENIGHLSINPKVLEGHRSRNYMAGLEYNDVIGKYWKWFKGDVGNHLKDLPEFTSFAFNFLLMIGLNISKHSYKELLSSKGAPKHSPQLSNYLSRALDSPSTIAFIKLQLDEPALARNLKVQGFFRGLWRFSAAVKSLQPDVFVFGCDDFYEYPSDAKLQKALVYMESYEEHCKEVFEFIRRPVDFSTLVGFVGRNKDVNIFETLLSRKDIFMARINKLQGINEDDKNAFLILMGLDFSSLKQEVPNGSSFKKVMSSHYVKELLANIENDSSLVDTGIDSIVQLMFSYDDYDANKGLELFPDKKLPKQYFQHIKTLSKSIVSGDLCSGDESLLRAVEHVDFEYFEGQAPLVEKIQIELLKSLFFRVTIVDGDAGYEFGRHRYKYYSSVHDVAAEFYNFTPEIVDKYLKGNKKLLSVDHDLAGSSLEIKLGCFENIYAPGRECVIRNILAYFSLIKVGSFIDACNRGGKRIFGRKGEAEQTVFTRAEIASALFSEGNKSFFEGYIKKLLVDKEDSKSSRLCLSQDEYDRRQKCLGNVVAYMGGHDIATLYNVHDFIKFFGDVDVRYSYPSMKPILTNEATAGLLDALKFSSDIKPHYKFVIQRSLIGLIRDYRNTDWRYSSKPIRYLSTKIDPKFYNFSPEALQVLFSTSFSKEHQQSLLSDLSKSTVDSHDSRIGVLALLVLVGIDSSIIINNNDLRLILSHPTLKNFLGESASFYTGNQSRQSLAVTGIRASDKSSRYRSIVDNIRKFIITNNMVDCLKEIDSDFEIIQTLLMSGDSNASCYTGKQLLKKLNLTRAEVSTLCKRLDTDDDESTIQFVKNIVDVGGNFSYGEIFGNDQPSSNSNLSGEKKGSSITAAKDQSWFSGASKVFKMVEGYCYSNFNKRFIAHFLPLGVVNSLLMMLNSLIIVFLPSWDATYTRKKYAESFMRMVDLTNPEFTTTNIAARVFLFYLSDFYLNIALVVMLCELAVIGVWTCCHALEKHPVEYTAKGVRELSVVIFFITFMISEPIYMPFLVRPDLVFVAIAAVFLYPDILDRVWNNLISIGVKDGSYKTYSLKTLQVLSCCMVTNVIGLSSLGITFFAVNALIYTLKVVRVECAKPLKAINNLLAKPYSYFFKGPSVEEKCCVLKPDSFKPKSRRFKGGGDERGEFSSNEGTKYGAKKCCPA